MMTPKKRSKVSIFLFLGLILSLVTSCFKGDDEALLKEEGDLSDVESIAYGTSFGFCVGYCSNTSLFKSESVMHTRSARGSDLETLICTNGITNDMWDTLVKSIDIETFIENPETIGCPDCADGGAEWIEIELFSGKKHKVTFEYFKEPEPLKLFLTKLRKQVANTNQCLN